MLTITKHIEKKKTPRVIGQTVNKKDAPRFLVKERTKAQAREVCSDKDRKTKPQEKNDFESKMKAALEKMTTSSLYSQKISAFIESLESLSGLQELLNIHAKEVQDELPVLIKKKDDIDIKKSELQKEYDAQSTQMQALLETEQARGLIDHKQDFQNRLKLFETQHQSQANELKVKFNQIGEEIQENELKIDLLKTEIEKQELYILQLKGEQDKVSSSILALEQQNNPMFHHFNEEKQQIESEEAAITTNLSKEVEEKAEKMKQFEDEIKQLQQQIDEDDNILQSKFLATMQIQNMVDKSQKFIKNHELFEKKFQNINYNEDQSNNNQRKKDQINEDIERKKVLLAQLSTQKLLAISTKNFLDAKSLIDRIKQLEKEIQQNNDELAEINKIIMESEAIAKEYHFYQNGLNRIDYDFCESFIMDIENLMRISKYANKLLSPIHQIAKICMNEIHKPNTMSTEEINFQISKLTQELEEAVFKDDYESVATIQHELDTIKGKTTKT